MKLKDKENFEISCGGAIKNLDNYPSLEECLNLKILGVIQEEKQNKAMIELGNGKKLFIETKKDTATRYLAKVVQLVRQNYIGKSLKTLIEHG